MLITINGEKKEMPALWIEGNTVKYIDQSALPGNFTILEAKSSADVREALVNMRVRGAPSIGAFAALGLAVSVKNGEDLKKAMEAIRSSRPTANDLFFALDIVSDSISGDMDPMETAEKYAAKVVKESKKIGEIGSRLIRDNMNILTHCNAGALATVDWGTALSPIRFARRDLKQIFVYVDETRPVLQGARLTAWELLNEDIENRIIADNAAGYLMYKGDIDMVIVGADRIAKNGDFANKIGTYEKAVLAKENGIPFYVAAPTSTFDPELGRGAEIPIEIRDEREILYINGVRNTPENARAYNPAFDVTPFKYVTGYITPFGIYKPSELFLMYSRMGR